MASTIVSFILNGREVEVIAKPLVTLQTVLREQLGYTATKSGCKKGGCGSCTVLLNGDPVMSCLLPAADIAGQEVVTLEGRFRRSQGDIDGLHIRVTYYFLEQPQQQDVETHVVMRSIMRQAFDLDELMG